MLPGTAIVLYITLRYDQEDNGQACLTREYYITVKLYMQNYVQPDPCFLLLLYTRCKILMLFYKQFLYFTMENNKYVG